MAERGFVSIVGAGPGDPGLITVRALERLRSADAVVYDRLVGVELLDEAPPRAARIAVGKAPGHQPWPQERINRLLVVLGRRGRRVVRLKGGDPFVFGRGSEECAALQVAGVPFEIVPGVSSAVAAPASAGIPLTHRGLARSVMIVTGHTNDPEEGPDWVAAARADTLVVLMGLGRIAEIMSDLRRAGRDPHTPAAVICRATTRDQLVVRGTLADIAQRAADLSGPATIVVGAVVGCAVSLARIEAEAAGRLHGSAA